MAQSNMRKRQQLTGWVLVLPAVLVLLLVYAYPIGRAFWLSLFTQNLGTQLEPVATGLGNYARIWGDGAFWNSIWNTTVFTVIALTLELILGMAIALVLNRSFRGRGVVRTIAILPWALPTAIMALAWTWIFNDQYGVVNDILMRLGLIDSGINWLGGPHLSHDLSDYGRCLENHVLCQYPTLSRVTVNSPRLI